jgi:hypothetical protein
MCEHGQGDPLANYSFEHRKFEISPNIPIFVRVQWFSVIHDKVSIFLDSYGCDCFPMMMWFCAPIYRQSNLTCPILIKFRVVRLALCNLSSLKCCIAILISVQRRSRSWSASFSVILSQGAASIVSHSLFLLLNSSFCSYAFNLNFQFSWLPSYLLSFFLWWCCSCRFNVSAAAWLQFSGKQQGNKARRVQGFSCTQHVGISTAACEQVGR